MSGSVFKFIIAIMYITYEDIGIRPPFAQNLNSKVQKDIHSNFLMQSWGRAINIRYVPYALSIAQTQHKCFSYYCFISLNLPLLRDCIRFQWNLSTSYYKLHFCFCAKNMTLNSQLYYHHIESIKCTFLIFERWLKTRSSPKKHHTIILVSRFQWWDRYMLRARFCVGIKEMLNKNTGL